MEILEDRAVTTRKPHNCHGCATSYPAGSRMRLVKNVDGWTILASYWCGLCVTFMDSLESWETQDGFTYGELMEMPGYPSVSIQALKSATG